MPVKIQNPLTDADYDTICTVLTSELYRVPAGYNWVEILPETALEPPIHSLGVLGTQITSQDYKTYSTGAHLSYGINNRGFNERVLKALKSKVGEKYDVKGGEKIFNVSNDQLGYLVQAGGIIADDVEIKADRNRPIKKSVLKTDIPFLLDLIETSINTSYELVGKDFDLDIYAQVRHPGGKIEAPMSLGDIFKSLQRFDKTVAIEERPKITFDDIGGCDEAKSELMLLAYGLQNPGEYEKWGLRYPKGILMYGLPGTGKTLLAKAMANAANASFYSVSASDISSMWYGESEKLMNGVFDVAQKSAPSIVLFDEIDSIAPHRAYSHEATKRVVSILLQRMDGMKELSKVTVMGTTNFIENVDTALLRPGRFDKVIEVPLPDEKAREQIYRLHTRGKRVDDEINYRTLAQKSDGLSGADIEAIVQLGLQYKLREDIANKDKTEIGPLTTDDIAKVLETYKSKRDKLPNGMKSRSYMYVS